MIAWVCGAGTQHAGQSTFGIGATPAGSMEQCRGFIGSAFGGSTTSPLTRFPLPSPHPQYGKTALAIAKEQNHAECVEALEAAEAKAKAPVGYVWKRLDGRGWVDGGSTRGEG